MLIVLVDIYVKDGVAEQFRAATLDNARNSVKEPGIARFDVLQDRADAHHFQLIEVYRSDDAPAAHKETAHYQKWRAQVEDMMAKPRSSTKFDGVFPEDGAW